MDKTIKINLAGIVFHIEEDAYHLLRDYLNAIESRLKNVPGGNETLDDIESRIAEIFQSQKGTAGIISRENVDSMMGIIGKPEDFEQETWEGREAPRFTSDRRRLYRNPGDTIVSGVCGGIGAYLGVEAVWIRLAFILFTLTFGIGFFIYIALWIALPNAYSENQKREMYGDRYTRNNDYKKDASAGMAAESFSEHRTASVGGSAGNAINEIFRAIGKFFYVILRIILIALGVSFVLAGFATLVAFIMTFIFQYPSWFFLDSSAGPQLFYLPDMLDFLMSPRLTPWVMILFSISVILPLLAIIYWGIKMIFWIRVRDHILSLVALIIWVISLSALALIMFNQGISFADEGSRTDQTILESRHDTVYLKVDRKISSLKYDQEISLPQNEYSLFINKAGNRLYGKPALDINYTEKSHVSIEVERYSRGKSRREAIEKAESLIYSYRISGDTICIDQYYEIPSAHKWSGSMVEIDIDLPEGTIIHIGKEAELLLDDWQGNNVNSWELGGKFWRWTEDGPERAAAKDSD